MRTEVVIVGAGMAGLAAARALAQRGVSALVIEARDRAGGRVLSQKVSAGEGAGNIAEQAVELGAEFVHGRPAELWALIEEFGLQTTERQGAMLREEWEGGLAQDSTGGSGDDDLFAPLEDLESFASEDVSFAEWLAASRVPEPRRPALLNYVEGFNAADARKIGVLGLGEQQKAEDAIEGDRSWHIQGGYAQLAERLAAQVRELGAEIRLNCVASSMTWSPGEVSVRTMQGEIAASRCVLTLPLSLVQNVNREGGLRIDPEPAAVAQARRLRMGQATRFTMLFRESWWQRSRALDAEALRTLNFLFTPRRMPPVWWTSSQPPAAMTGRPPAALTGQPLAALTGWIGGPRAATLAGRSAEDLGREACALLARVFAVEEPVVRAALLSVHTHDWAADPYSLGAYSYVPVGAIDAPAKMAEPQANTLYFAGEHTDITASWGTVHAAIRSGLRAATQILEAFGGP